MNAPHPDAAPSALYAALRALQVPLVTLPPVDCPGCRMCSDPPPITEDVELEVA